MRKAILILILYASVHMAFAATDPVREQIEHGKHLFQSTCAMCHGDDAHRTYMHAAQRWKTLGDMYAFVSTKMPANAPGSLKSKDYVDLISYLLSTNSTQVGNPPMSVASTSHSSQELSK